MQLGGRDEGVDARARGVLERLSGPFDVGPAASSERGHGRPADLGGNAPDRLGVGVGGNREARLDDVHAQRIERAREARFFLDVHRESGGLFAVAERRVEDRESIRHAAVVRPLVQNCQIYLS
jgi:hypothetical protein